MEFLRWIGLGLSLLVLVGFGLASSIDRLELANQSITFRALLLLIPGLAATLWSWNCEISYDLAVHRAVNGVIDGRGTTHAKEPSRWSQLWSMFRLQAAWLVIPVLVLLAVIDFVQWALGFDPATGALVSGGVALLALPLLLPTILGRIWTLRPVADKDLDQWLNSLVRANGTRGLRVLEWQTDGSFCTAMVAGFLPGFRRLLLSDGLLWRLSRQQTAMVVLHELAHLRRFHLPLRMFVLVPVWGAASAATQAMGDFQYADVCGIGVGLICSLLSLRWIAYRTEFDADAVAVRLAVSLGGKVPFVPDNAADASAALADALLLVTADQPSSRKATWMHPSIDARTQALLRPHALDQHASVPSVLYPHAAHRSDPSGLMPLSGAIAPFLPNNSKNG
jgi:Zn-dependent protease with chaperone function